MASILSKMQTVLHRMLDALAGAWMRRAASEAERPGHAEPTNNKQ
jgi:hypothetical protein